SMMLVGGYSGIGKTSLIHELYKPIVRERGYFIAGKFEQVARSIPFGALIQAFRGLIRQLLTESEESLARWRANISEALGASAGVMAEVIPEIELMLGRQPPPPALGPTEAQNRFQLVFQNFVAALARREHPLVIFLDDLQWVDSATLSLFQPLLLSPDIKYLFLIGAYRDNEIDASHPLLQLTGSLESNGVPVERISLGPLALPDLLLLIGDTLHRDRAEVEPLARLVERKTGGNPFFVIQFLRALWQERLIEFDYERVHWSFRLEAIAETSMTDNVIDLMTRKIQRLSPKAQSALTLGACIGNSFDLPTLAIISRQSRASAAEDLREAIEEGLVLASAGTGPQYAFLHDRVQQAAYALIPAERRQSAHLSVGRLLLDKWDGATAEERIFDLAGHLNLGSALITDEAERLELARLNLNAGRKAKSATAFEEGLAYFKAGARLLGEERWQTDYDLVFALHIEAAECEYLCGNFEEAEERFESLLRRPATIPDKARVYGLRIVQYENLSRYADALASARECLALFGLSFPDSTTEKQAALETEIDLIQRLIGDRDIGSLIELPVMTDPEVRIIMSILTAIWPSAYISGDQVLTRLISAMMVRLSLTHGNSEESAYGYVTHAITVGPVREDYRSAYEFGSLALKVNERFADSKRRAKIYQQFQAHVNLWRQPLQTSIPLAREACRSGLETGDFTYAVYGAFTESWAALMTNRDLDGFVRECSPNLALIRKLRAANFADGQSLLLNWARALQGETLAPLSLSNEEFDENDYLSTYRDNPFFEMFFYSARLHLYYLFEEYEKALVTARSARRIAHHLLGTIWPVLLDFWNGLTLAALYAEAGEYEQRDYLREMERIQSSFAVLAENCPENFLCQSLLLSAEIERVRGRELSALKLYGRASRYAEETGMLQHHALAAELCAKFWLEIGHDNVAAVFMTQARSDYAKWGAAAKVEDLDRKHAGLLKRREDEIPRKAESVSGATATASLDVATAMKAAQAIASEIDLEKLLALLVSIAIENAGAERGCLVLERDGEAYVRAEGAMDRVELRAREALPLERAQDLPKAIVNYVRRTSESVVLSDAHSDDRYATDEYIARRRPRSILCAPVLNQGRLIGVLYLENNLVTGAFTADRIKLMQLISTEAAISLENARLYDEMKQEVALRRRAEEELRAALIEVEKLKNRLQAENLYLQEEIHKEHNFEEIVGNSPALLDLLANVERVAPTDSTVLIQGETGTGKELIARAIHNRSSRKDRPLVKVNCGAISAGLVESELFVHVKGAFTGALERRVGRFELADRGTLFLDEISELPVETQVKLLRVLQEGEFEAVGSSRTIRVDVRIIAATNRNLEEEVRQGRFRSDLFYRLNVFPVRVPSLAERR
ncbi:MAG TPA: sigma 54-interacting transcriptional regulator, partial [Blastocatellia bacterium]|nr:sigma 54-interacting transcriptional regulator [Blastocatellia bacterium]